MEIKDIFEAAEYGTLEDVRHFIEDDSVNVNAGNSLNETPLHLAATRYVPQQGIEIVKYLLSTKEINVNAKNDNGDTPLNSAAYKGNIEAIEALLSHKDIDANLPDNDGYTPFHNAIKQKKIDVVKRLVAVDGIKVNTISEWKTGRGVIRRETPIHAAVFVDSIELVNILVSNGADINVKAGTMEHGGMQTPLEQAMFCGCPAIIEYLSTGVLREWTLDGELAEIEALVNDCEEKIKDGRYSVNTLRHQAEEVYRNAGKEAMDAKVRSQIKEMRKINIHRLNRLKEQYPDDFRILKLGNKATKCFLKLGEILTTLSDGQVNDEFEKEIYMEMFPDIDEGENVVVSNNSSNITHKTTSSNTPISANIFGSVGGLTKVEKERIEKEQQQKKQQDKKDLKERTAGERKHKTGRISAILLAVLSVIALFVSNYFCSSSNGIGEMIFAAIFVMIPFLVLICLSEDCKVRRIIFLIAGIALNLWCYQNFWVMLHAIRV